MTENTKREENDALDVKSAQERIASAFGTADDDGNELAEGEVVAMNGDEIDGSDDNPFAKEAVDAEILRRLEALLFASPSPMAESVIAERVPGADLPRQLEMLERHYERRGINLRKVNNAWQFVTAPDVANVLVEHRSQQRKLSRAALETLAIIAYHQPCSRAEIEEIRGVAVAKGSLDQLLELGWIRPRGRRDVPGRPVIYGTTPAFLEHFGLEALSHLPGLQDLKAAGLLEARLPPGFEVPTPRAGDEEIDDQEGAAAEADFTVDFTEDDSTDLED